MEIQQKDDGKTGMFFIEQDDEIVAELVYSWKGKDRITIEHTEVDDVLKGKGAGKELVVKSVEFAREKSTKIIPICSFAKSVFDKTKEFQDVL
jgi:uncharacterized protein